MRLSPVDKPREVHLEAKEKSAAAPAPEEGVPVPLLVEFTVPSSLFREPDRHSTLRIIGNGPAGTFVLFPDGLRVSLPTDQIVFADDNRGHARVGFGGMQFVGQQEETLVFTRVREVLPPEQLSPDRSHTMRLDPRHVAAIAVDGRRVWPVRPA